MSAIASKTVDVSTFSRVAILTANARTSRPIAATVASPSSAIAIALRMVCAKRRTSSFQGRSWQLLGGTKNRRCTPQTSADTRRRVSADLNALLVAAGERTWRYGWFAGDGGDHLGGDVGEFDVAVLGGAAQDGEGCVGVAVLLTHDDA